MVHTPSPLIADAPPVAAPPADDVAWIKLLDGGFAQMIHVVRFACEATAPRVTVWLSDGTLHHSEDAAFFPPVATQQQEPPDAE